MSTNSLHNRKTFAELIKSSYNVTLNPSSIYLSNYLYAKYLSSLTPPIKNIYCLGNPHFQSEFKDFTLLGTEDKSNKIIDPQAILKIVKERKIDVVIVGLDKEYIAYNIFVSSFAVELGAKLMVTTRQVNFEESGELLPDAGAIVAGIEVSTTTNAESILEETSFPFEIIIKENELKGKTLIILEKEVVIGKLDLDVCRMCEDQVTDAKYSMSKLNII